MLFPPDQVQELKSIYPNLQSCDEGGYTYFSLPKACLPENCDPSQVDLLLCPMSRDGYTSRLYFSEQINSGKPLNWHVQAIRILEHNWYAFSWQIPHNDLRLAQMVAVHLGGLR